LSVSRKSAASKTCAGERFGRSGLEREACSGGKSLRSQDHAGPCRRALARHCGCGRCGRLSDLCQLGQDCACIGRVWRANVCGGRA
jgi:hypothetical protein